MSIDEAMHNVQSYPLKYAEMIIPKEPDGVILEAGCGPGRLVKFYHNAGCKIIGIDFIGSVIERLQKQEPSLNLEQADIRNLRFASNSFSYVLAFGLYHNLEEGLEQALAETARVLNSGGKLCASFRADNIQNMIVDKLSDMSRSRTKTSMEKRFHKINFTEKEVLRLIEKPGFTIEKVFPVENMPLLYKFRLFRHRDHKSFNEALGRKEGYKLNFAGLVLQKLLLRVFPKQFCNLFVVIATKK